MASLAQEQLLTLEDFDRLYGDRKPYHEYWFGQAIPKPMPLLLHGLLQKILLMLLDEIGFESGAEIRLKLSNEAQPLPDVIATSKPIGSPYPTQPFEVAVEILSPSDAVQYLYRKCRMYSQWGIQHIFVFDPDDRTAQEWNHSHGYLESIDVMRFENRKSIPVDRIWAELDFRAKRLGLLPD